jgi:hypothetical protein
MKDNQARSFVLSHMKAMLCVVAFIHVLTKMAIHIRAIIFFIFSFFFKGEREG